MKRIAVVGGGAAGLAAAWRLASSGVEVTVFERAQLIGGRARSEQLDGCISDAGAQLFGSGFSALFRIAREVGAESLLVRSPGRDALYRDGRIHPIAYGSVRSMITSTALPASLKFKLGARYVPFLLRHARQLNASNPLAAGGDALDNESVADWGARELGSDFVELLAAPLLGAYYGSTPERTGAALYHALARAGLEVSVYAVRGGTGELMRALANATAERGAVVRTGMEVTRVVASDKRVRIELGEASEEFEGAVIAVPAPDALRLVQLPAAISVWLEKVEFTPAAVLAVVLEESFDADFFGLSLLRTQPEVSDLVAVCVQARKAPGLVPANRALLTCLGSPAAGPSLVENPEAAIERMLAALEHIFPGTRQKAVKVKLYRHAAGYPVFYPGYLKHLRRYPVDALPADIQLAGDYLVAPTIEGALRSGERAARAITG
ncbi:MAG: protoporphyrinogen/coproporphyrinogen oxidase [Gemmatimonadota bacterium]